MAQLTKTNISTAQQQEAHGKLVRYYKQLGLTHNPCSVPGCKGYTPQKSALEIEGFRAYQAALWKR